MVNGKTDSVLGGNLTWVRESNLTIGLDFLLIELFLVLESSVCLAIPCCDWDWIIWTMASGLRSRRGIAVVRYLPLDRRYGSIASFQSIPIRYDWAKSRPSITPILRAEHTINLCLNVWPSIVNAISIMPGAPTELPEACLTMRVHSFSNFLFGKYLFWKSSLTQEQLAPVSTIADTIDLDTSFTVIEIVNIGFFASSRLTVCGSSPHSSSLSSPSESLFEPSSSDMDERRWKYFDFPEPSELPEVSSGKVVSDISFSLSLHEGISWAWTMLTCLLLF